MPVTQMGIVYYADDPHKRVFRRVYPTFDDSELDQPATNAIGKVMVKPDGTPMTWTSFGDESTRPVQMDKVANPDTTKRLRGTVHTPSSEPVVYFINVDPILSALSTTQLTTVNNWINAHSSWSNNFVDLGSGDVPTLTVNLVSPCWIVVADSTAAPSIGVLQRSTSIGAHLLALWTA